MIKPYVWNPDQSLEDQKDGAYWERNMLALFMATIANDSWQHDARPELECGWYVHGEWEGWGRVISLFGGQYTFHVPDDFDVGRLPKIEANWDGHTTEAKWERVAKICGCGLSAPQPSIDQ